jgi:hypothetical protein
MRHTQVMSLSGDIRTAARRVSCKVFGASAAVALLASCAVVALTTRSLPPVLTVLIGGLAVVFFAGPWTPSRHLLTAARARGSGPARAAAGSD